MTLFSGPGEGPQLDTFDGVHTVKAGAADTGGAYEVFEIDVPNAPAMPLHQTPWAKTLYLLAGALSVQVEHETFELEPGASITIPAGAAHTFTVTSPSAKFLGFTTGGGAGRLFADIVRSVPRDRPMDEIVPIMLEVAQRNDVTFPPVADRPPVPST